MICTKCNGLMVDDKCYDYTGARIFVERCVNCGNIEDEVIITNRYSLPIDNFHNRGARPSGIS